MWPFSRANSSGFSGSSTAEEVTKGIDGTGLTAIVTGASSGIGLETARVLALRGVHVIMSARNLSACTKIKESIIKEIPTAKIDVLELDLSSFASVRKFASDFLSLNLPLNILINNAGITSPFSLSAEGLELHFATNHVGHFLLTNLLLENMERTSRSTKIEGRIVNVSSMAHIFSSREGIPFDKINNPSEFSQLHAYGQSKLANILHANELSRRFREKGIKITANSLHPGVISTNLTRHHSFVHFLNRTVGKLLFKNIQQGAATTCYVALHPLVEGISGKYFKNCDLASPSAKSVDPDLAKRLWDFSMELVG